MHSLYLYIFLFTATTAVFNTATAEKFIGDLIETADVGFTTGGRWSREKRCPPASFVTAYGFRYGHSDGNVIAVAIQCSILDAEEKASQVVATFAIETPNREKERGAISFLNSSTYAIGFSLQSWLDSEGYAAIGGRQFNFYDEDEIEAVFPPNSTEKRVEQYLCAKDYGVCGIQARIKGGNETHPGHITRLRFRCCYYCQPEEQTEVVFDAENGGNSPMPFTYRKKFGMQIQKSTSESHDEENVAQQGAERSNTDSTTLSQGGSNATGNTKSSSGILSTTQSRRNSKYNGSSLDLSFTKEKGNRNQSTDGGNLINRNLDSVGETQIDGQVEIREQSNAATVSEARSNTAGISSDSSNTVTTSTADSTTTKESFNFQLQASFFGIFSAGFNTDHESDKTRSNTNEKAVTSSDTRSRENSVTRGSSEDKRRRNEQQRTTQLQRDRKNDVEQSVTKQWDTLIGSSENEIVGKSSTNDFNINHESSTDVYTALEQTVSANKQLSIEKSIQNSAQETFQSHSSRGLTTRFSWEKANSEIWHTEKEEILEIACDPMSRCVMTQITGKCGALTVRTPRVVLYRTDVTTFEAPTVAPEADPEEAFKIDQGEEVWIVARNISFSSPSKKWGSFQTCPEGSVVIGHQHRIVETSEWKPITGLKLLCSEVKRGEYSDDERYIESTTDGSAHFTGARGHWTDEVKHKGDQWAIGYRFVRTLVNGSNFLGNHELIYAGMEAKPLPRQEQSNVQQVLCPPMHAVCGMATMLDEHGNGEVTNAGLKCCHHCIPEEHFLDRLNTENGSSEPSSHTISITVGKRNETTQTSGQSSSKAHNHDIPTIRSGFATKIGKSTTTGYDWKRTEESFWNHEETQTVDFACPAYHKCSYKQLIGYCGSYEFPTNQFCILAVPETPSFFEQSDETWVSLKTHASPLEVIKGHIFISFKLIADVKTGDWEPIQLCPPGAVATRVVVKVEEGAGITGLGLQCSRLKPYTEADLYEEDSRITVETPNGEGEWMKSKKGRKGKEPLTPISGFYFDWKENAEMEGFDLSYGPLYHRIPPRDIAQANSCPKEYEICGFHYRMDAAERYITDVKFKCCIHCVPKEEWKDRDSFINLSGSSRNNSISYNVGITERHSSVIVSHIGSANENKDALLGVSILEALFSHRFPNLSPKHFSWSTTPSSFWGEVRLFGDSYLCAPHSFCRYRQLHGVCGTIHIPTGHKYVKSHAITPEDLGDDDEQ